MYNSSTRHPPSLPPTPPTLFAWNSIPIFGCVRFLQLNKPRWWIFPLLKWASKAAAHKLTFCAHPLRVFLARRVCRRCHRPGVPPRFKGGRPASVHETSSKESVAVRRECACRSGKATTAPVGSLNSPCIAHHSLIQRQRKPQQRHPGASNMVQKCGPVDGDTVYLLWTTAGFEPFLPSSSHWQCFSFKYHAIKMQSHSTVFTVSVYKICIDMQEQTPIRTLHYTVHISLALEILCTLCTVYKMEANTLFIIFKLL